MPPNLQLFFKGHHHRWFSVNIFMSKYFFIASLSFHVSMRSQMFYKIDVPENPAKLTRNCLYQTFLTPTQIFFSKFFAKFRNPFFTEHLRTTASDFNTIFLSAWIRFCFRTDQYLFNIPSYQFMAPDPLGPHTFST